MTCRHKPLRTIALVCLFAVLACLLCIHSVNASSVPVFTKYGKLSEDKTILSLSDGTTSYIPDFSESWSAFGDISSADIRVISGIRFYSADVNTRNSSVSFSSGGCSFLFDLSAEKDEIGKYSSFFTGITIRGSQSLSRSYPVEIRIDTTAGTVTYYSTVHGVYSASDMVYVNVDLSSVSGEPLSLAVNIQFSEEDAPVQIRLSSPVFLNDSSNKFVYAGNYLASDMDCVNCTFDPVSKNIVPSASDFTIQSKYAGPLSSFFGRMFFFVNFKEVPGGVLTFSVSSHDYGISNERKTSTVRIPLIPEVLNYAIPVETYGYIESFSMSFSGISTDNASIILDSITASSGAEPVRTTSYGTLTSIKKNGNTISFSGTADRSYIKENHESSIVFLAVGDSGTPVELGSTQLTTKFDFSIDISDTGLSSDTCRFSAAFKDPEGNLSMMSEPRFYDSATPAYIPTTKLGISGGTAAGAFESNASHYIADIPLDTLISEENTIFELKYSIKDGFADNVCLNKSLVERLDDDIKFCLSAGIRVYIRFLSPSPVKGLTYPESIADNYALYLPDENSKRLYCAIVSFLAERYSGIDGFILGSNVLSVKETGASFVSDPVGYSESLAEICRMTYNAASDFIPDIYTIVPAGASDNVSVSLFTTVFSDCMNKVGSIPWFLLYNTVNFDTDVSQIENSEKILSAMNIPSFSEYMLYCKFNDELLSYSQNAGIDFEDYLSAKIIETCAGSEKARAVFVSLNDSILMDKISVFRVLQDAEESGGHVYEGAAAVDAPVTDKGSLPLWDFKDIYYNPGFITAGIENLLSDFGRYTENSTERVLRFSSSAGDKGIGIVLGTLNESLDLSVADSISFDIALSENGPDDQTALIFVFGTNDSRAEYYSPAVSDGKMHRYTCTISDESFEGTADFIGIMISSDSECTGEISEISIGSREKTESELNSLLFPQPGIENDGTETRQLVIISATLLVITAIIAVLLIKREKEEKLTTNRKAVKQNGKRQQ